MKIDIISAKANYIKEKFVNFWQVARERKNGAREKLLSIINTSLFIVALNFLSGNMGIFSATFGRLCALILLALVLIINSPLKLLRKAFPAISLFGAGMIRDSRIAILDSRY